MIWMIIGLLAMLLFIGIAATYNTPFVESIDKWAADKFYGNGFLEAFHVIGNTETIIILTLIFALLLLMKDRAWQASVFVIITVALGFGLNQLLKAIFERPRPDVVDQLTSFSFPSGHAMATTICLLTLVFIAHQQFWIGKQIYSLYAMAFTVAMLVALSRVAGARHYFSDIVAGVSIGIAFVVVAAYTYRKTLR